MRLSFTKMQCAGNDYIYFDCLSDEGDGKNWGEIAKSLSKRRFSVGADGIVLILPSKTAHARMRIFNADGSEAKMCGNAIRCVGKLLFESNFIKKSHIRIDTESGIRDLYLTVRDGTVGLVTVDMGVSFAENDPFTLSAEGETYELRAVNIGNDHQVAFIEEVDTLALDRIGYVFERNPRFEDGVNTEFCSIIGKNHLKMRVFERGSGETLSCGTGACAAAVAGVLKGACDIGRPVRISMRGGELFALCDENFRVFLTGEATRVFEGTVEI